MQSKHLWDNFSIDWYKLDSKLYSSKPTGHSRELLWTHLFVQKHRQNPFQEREYQGDDSANVFRKWYADQRYMKAYQSTKTLRGIDVEGAMMGFNVDNLTAKQALLDAKDKHARRPEFARSVHLLQSLIWISRSGAQQIQHASSPRTWIMHYLQAKIVHENFSSKVKKKKLKLQFLFRASQK